IYFAAGQKPLGQFSVTGYRRVKLRAYPRTAFSFCLKPPFCPPPWRRTFIVVLSIITSLKAVASSFYSFSRICAHNPRLLPHETGRRLHAKTRIHQANHATGSQP
ncbi:MAG: hypothetical protein LBT00_10960, partial [Spirochaetaceae bacterium]|nr:hypothetical protein [Spirochaetaceae bacterium]